MSNTTSTATIGVLREVFSRHGLPEVIVSDNGPQFMSSEFRAFCNQNGILHRTSAVHKPSSNGQAERVVQILKSALKQARLTNTNVDTMLARYLMNYRSTPHTTTGEPPSVLLMGRRLRTRLDLILPSVHVKVESGQGYTMSRTASRGCRQFYCGDQVQARNYGQGEKWTRGVITGVLGNRYYSVDVNGRTWKRHIDQLIKCSVETPDQGWTNPLVRGPGPAYYCIRLVKIYQRWSDGL